MYFKVNTLSAGPRKHGHGSATKATAIMSVKRRYRRENVFKGTKRRAARVTLLWRRLRVSNKRISKLQWRH